MQKIILASSSPRRKMLLSKLNIDFETVSPLFDESEFKLEPINDSVENLSLLKAKSISVILTVSALVISADTVVICDDKILGKPKDRNEAYQMLKMLSGKTHKVITGIAVINSCNNNVLKNSDTTYVSFNDLSDADIYSYIDNKKPFDKAGSYGIQELPDNFIKSIDGDLENVIGLPTKILIKMLKTIN